MRFGNWEQALFSYTNAIQHDPSCGEAYMKRAALNERIGRIQEAMADYSNAILFNPQSAYIYDKRAKLRLIASDYKGALEDSNTAISLNEFDNEFRNTRVDEWIMWGEFDKAITEIDTLIRRGYEPSYELMKRSFAEFHSGDAVKARKSLDSALTINPHFWLSYDMLGLLELREGNPMASIINFNKAIELKPDYALAWYNRAIAFRYLGNKEAAIADLNRSLELNMQNEQIYFLRGIMKKESGDLEGAIEDYSIAAVSSERLYTDVLYNRAYTLKMLGEYDLALHDSEIILSIEPESPEHWNLKGNIHLLFGSYQAAIDAYSEAISRQGDYGEALYNRGLAYCMSYRIREGCGDFEMSKNAGFMRSEEAIRDFCNY
jgi:tetratricopeptide (TPR) repeat protein